LDRESPHLPHPSPIDAYGGGGFRFAGMSHRGSLFCLPTGIWASSVTTPTGINERSLALVLDEAARIEHCLIGTGSETWTMPSTLRELFEQRHIVVETMTTSAAVHTYNILLGENRRVAALLIAVD
jgi:uncharacterized protein